jgi:hypothetical protein
VRRFVSFKEEQSIVEKMDAAAEEKGICRSGFIRSCIRMELKRLQGETDD